ncbi:kynurenine formamidase-like [Styela clava]
MIHGDNQKFDPEIDHMYMPSKWSKRHQCEQIFLTYLTKESSDLRDVLKDWVEVVRYGKGQKQIFEILRDPEVKEDAPIMIFLHGGYWVESDREIYLICAEPAAKRGFIGIVVGYDQAPDVSLTTIVNEIRDAYLFLSRRYTKCPSITLLGHSAGGHLGSMLMATNWKEYNTSGEKLIPIKRLVSLAPVLDLRPVVHISYNSYLHLTDDEITNLSPLQQVENSVHNMKIFGTKVLSVVGEHDPPVLKKKSGEYAEALKKNSIDSKYFEIPGLDHFEPIEQIREPDSFLAKCLFDEDGPL